MRGRVDPRRAARAPGWVVAAVACGLAGAAQAQPGGVAADPAEDPAPSPGADVAALVHDREIGARLGLGSGGRVTPGGLRVVGLYLYQLSALDWFEGDLGFTFGAGGAACFRDREGALVCDHGPLSGGEVTLAVGIRRFLTPKQSFAPYLRVLVGARVVQYADDEVRGVAIPLIVGAGVRAAVSELVSVGADATVEAGAGWFGDGLGAEPQLGLQVAATVTFRLR